MKEYKIPDELIDATLNASVYEFIRVETRHGVGFDWETRIWIIPEGNSIGFSAIDEQVIVQVLGKMPVADDGLGQLRETLDNQSIPGHIRIEWANQLINVTWPISFGSDNDSDTDGGAGPLKFGTTEGVGDGEGLMPSDQQISEWMVLPPPSFLNG